MISTKGAGRDDWSAEDAYSSAALDLTLAFVRDLDFVIAFWDYDYILHIVNLAILYFRKYQCSLVVFRDQVFQQSVSIPMSTNCARLLADLFFYSLFRQNLSRNCYGIVTEKLTMFFNHKFKYINGAVSINHHNLHNCVHLIDPDELERKDTTESDESAS
jgi:hypothetical protein